MSHFAFPAPLSPGRATSDPGAAVWERPALLTVAVPIAVADLGGTDRTMRGCALWGHESLSPASQDLRYTQLAGVLGMMGGREPALWESLCWRKLDRNTTASDFYMLDTGLDFILISCTSGSGYKIMPTGQMRTLSSESVRTCPK